MKTVPKKELRTKVANAINLVLFEIQIVPSKKIKNLVTEVSKKFASEVKKEWKKQARLELKAQKKQTKLAEKKAKKKLKQKQG